MANRSLPIYGWLSPRLSERYWSSVDDSAGPDACWKWTKTHNQIGYGLFSYGDPTSLIAAHKVAWILSNTKILEKGQVCHHRCRNRGCQNPAHLELKGSHSDHMTNNPDHKHSFGEGHFKAILRNNDIPKIRRLLRQREKHRVIADLFGVSIHTIRSIQQRRHWNHIAEPADNPEVGERNDGAGGAHKSKA